MLSTGSSRSYVDFSRVRHLKETHACAEKQLNKRASSLRGLDARPLRVRRLAGRRRSVWPLGRAAERSAGSVWTTALPLQRQRVGGTDTLAGAARPSDTRTLTHICTHIPMHAHTHAPHPFFFPLRHRRAQTHSDSVVCACVWRGGEETATSAHQAVSFNHFLSFVCYFFDD